jgi:hypothetical protein
MIGTLRQACDTDGVSILIGPSASFKVPNNRICPGTVLIEGQPADNEQAFFLISSA